ncbi:uncharacterized protein J4E88_010747 [Alternaria novae-zelandiae]|uniref:uncharacterized protein n=1 Tax=Alternaria novae-zelandiae TaxID=430562 RepID=UPI0020C426EB|nr:uncharacterized protein J4E88_010747 [Alternaria novae-zelandiae]KAI4663897.1 hypothetical protein J4E88_010747 [Alternaria novae-zelandiae]
MDTVSFGRQWLWAPDFTQLKPFLDTSYLAALLSPTTAEGSPRDSWGHIRVPRIEHYEVTSQPGNEGWYGTKNGTLESYSSFVGIPIGGMDSAEFIDYSTRIQSKYFHLACDPYDGNLQFIFNNSRWLGNVSWNENVTERAETSPDEVEPFAFVIAAHEFRVLNFRIRRSRLAHPPATYTQLGPLVGFKNTPWEAAGFDMIYNADQNGKWREYDGDKDLADLKGDDELVESGKFDTASLSNLYLRDPKNIMGNSATKPSEVGHETFAIRLSQVINAYWAAMYGKGTFLGHFEESTNPVNATSYGSWYDEEGNAGGNPFLLARAWSSTGTKRSNVEVFKAHYGWTIALIVSSTVLVAASLVPFCLRTFSSHGPDVLMNFSSLATRNNPYVALPVTGTYLDAADRSRLLKDVRIRFGDVEGGNAIGMLGIGRLDGDVAPLRKERKYA